MREKDKKWGWYKLSGSIGANKIAKQGNDIRSRAEKQLGIGWIKEHVTKQIAFELRSSDENPTV